MDNELGAADACIEWDLSLRLLSELHLSVPERRELPNGRVRGSVLIDIVEQALAENGWFPERRSPEDCYVGTLERRDGTNLLHKRYEIGVMRWGPVQTTRHETLEDAVRAYVRAAVGSIADTDTPTIDGVPVHWNA